MELNINTITPSYHCGPYNWPMWLKRIFSVWFNESCRLHDENYRLGLLTKDQYDALFLMDMLARSNTWHKKIAAYLFYFAVRTPWGQKSWDRNRELHG